MTLPAITFGFVVTLLLIAVLVYGAVTIVQMLISGRDSQMLTREERAQLQQLEALLGRMDERISNLETILMHNRAADDDRQGGK